MSARIKTIIACLIPFIGFWSYGLFDLDEGFYGAVVKDMLRRGDWITPTLNGVPWFEKPILSYWLAMPFVALFGNEFGARLPSFLATLATAWLWYRFFKRRENEFLGQIMAVAYCGSLLVLGVGRMMMTDAPLVLALTWGLFSFLEIAEGKPSQWKLGLAVGIGILDKGPVAGALLLGAGLVAICWVPAWRSTAFKGFWLAVVISLAVACLWFIPCWLANRDLFVQEFLIKQNVSRFAGGDTAHAVPLYLAPFYFPLVLLLALMPWTLWLRGSVYREIWLKWRLREPSWQTMVSAYALVVFTLFTISGSKLPHYILPAVGPLLALLLDAGYRVTEDHMPKLSAACLWNGSVAGLALCTFAWIDNAQFVDVRRLAYEANVINRPLAVVAENSSAQKGFAGQAETSSPSLGFYLKDRYKDGETLDQLINEKWMGLLFVRKGQIPVETVNSALLLGRQLTPIDVSGSNYELWSIDLGAAR